LKLELHLLQNFAPSNLNRDDTGAPKDCEFGGYRRARISSQCQKRAVRQTFEVDGLLDEEHRGARTKRLAQRVAEELHKQGRPFDAAIELATGAIEGVGLGRNKKGEGEELWKTEYLLFVPRSIVTDIANLLNAHADRLNGASSDSDATNDAKNPNKKRDRRDEKRAAKGAYPPEVRQALESLLAKANQAVDVALFGRMIADKPEWNVDAACQVAHAISTNRVQMDFDFFTAVDDLKPKDTAGSDMMGTVQFNSSCFYRYAVLDVNGLAKNLESETGLIQRAVRAFVQAFVSAIPTGKQNSMAAHNFPSYAMAVVRENGQALSLANAFLKPARPRDDKTDLVDDSIQKLESYAMRLRDVLGPSEWLSWADRDLPTADVAPTRVATLGEFFERVATGAVGVAS
jgi:CRISPR system Cascade subunit CasC